EQLHRGQRAVLAEAAGAHRQADLHRGRRQGADVRGLRSVQQVRGQGLGRQRAEGERGRGSRNMKTLSGVVAALVLVTAGAAVAADDRDADSWPTLGRDWRQSYYSPLRDID